MRRIARAEFERKQVVREWNIPWLEEMRWYEEGRALGLILLDMAQGDWNALVFQKDEEGRYRVADMALLYRTVDEACRALAKMLAEKANDLSPISVRDPVFA